MIDDKLMKSIDEAKYLATENTWRYRPIIRIFYKNYEKMKYWLYKEDIYEELKKSEYFKEYKLENLKYDLDVLVENKNLLTLQDTSKVKNIEEFKNKQFRYQLSPYTIELERMLIRLEKLSGESGASLEASLIERFKEGLEKISVIRFKQVSEIHEWWKELVRDFKSLNENYQDYIRGFYSPKAEEVMRTTEFLLFKEKFIKYLKEFIKGLQINIFKVERIIKAISDEDIKGIIEKVVEHERTIPRIDHILDEEEFWENNLGIWGSMKEWFSGNNYRKSDCEKLLDFTNEIIMKITRYAAQISERKNSSANRKMEYRKLFKLFCNCKDFEEANKLSAVTIGLFNMKHIRGNTIRETESINSSVFEEKPHEVILRPRVKTFREKTIKSPIRDKTEKKLEIQRELMETRRIEKELIEALIKNDRIDFSNLPVLKTFERQAILRWLSKGSNNKYRKARTEYGRDFEVIIDDSQRITVNCVDGEFSMPKCVIKFL